jgi:hypothetical protein
MRVEQVKQVSDAVLVVDVFGQINATAFASCARGESADPRHLGEVPDANDEPDLVEHRQWFVCHQSPAFGNFSLSHCASASRMLCTIGNAGSPVTPDGSNFM